MQRITVKFLDKILLWGTGHNHKIKVYSYKTMLFSILNSKMSVAHFVKKVCKINGIPPNPTSANINPIEHL